MSPHLIVVLLSYSAIHSITISPNRILHHVSLGFIGYPVLLYGWNIKILSKPKYRIGSVANENCFTLRKQSWTTCM